MSDLPPENNHGEAVATGTGAPPDIAAPPSEVEVPGKAKEVGKALQKLAEKKPGGIFEMMAITGGIGNPLHQKMEAEHITQVLTLAATHDENEFKLLSQKEKNAAEENSSNRVYLFLVFLTIIALFVVVICLFKDQPNVLFPIASGIGGFASGFAGGFGVGKKSK